MFNQGDVVVYRRHVCTVADVREKYFEDKDYLELHAVFEKSLKLYVSVEDAKPPILREPMTADQAQELLDRIPDIGSIDEEQLKAQSSTATLMERRVKEEYERLLKTLDPADLVPVLRATSARTAKREAAGRPIAATDKKYKDLAEQFLCYELSLSLGLEYDQVKALVEERLQA